MSRRRVSVLQKHSFNIDTTFEKKVLELANKQNSVGKYIVDTYDLNFLISQVNDQIFEILELAITNCPVKIGLEELILIVFSIFHHNVEQEQVYLANAVIQLYEQLIEHSPSSKHEGIKWEQVTDIFIKSLLEADNSYFGIHISKGALNKVIGNENENIRNMVLKLRLVQLIIVDGDIQNLPSQIEVDNHELQLFTRNTEIDKAFHKDGIQKAELATGLDRVLLLDIQSDFITSYDKKLKGIVRFVQTSQHNHKLDGVILDFSYSESHQRIGAVLRDNTLSFWDAVDNFKYEKIIRSPMQHFQIRIWYAEFGDHWITCDKTNNLYRWDIQNETFQTLPKAHNAKIMDFLEISHIKGFVLSSLDRKIVIWDSVHLVPRNIISVKNSIHCLSFSKALFTMFSASYTNNIEAWSFDGTAECATIYQLKGHESTVTCLSIIEDQSQLISADEHYRILCWNIYDRKCVQTFQFDTSVKVEKLIVTDQHSFISVSKRLHLFNFNSINYNQMTSVKRSKNTNNASIGYLEYFNYADQIVVGTKEEIRLIDFGKGTQCKIFSSLTQENCDITAIKLDHKEKQIFVADGDGHLRVMNIINGEFLQDMLYSKNNACIQIQIDYINGLLLSFLEDHTVCIQKKDIFDRVILRELRNPCGSQSRVTAFNSSFYLNKIAVACSNVVVVYTYNMLKLSSFCSIPGKMKNIAKIMMLEPFPIMMVVENNMKAYLFQCQETNKIHCCPVISMIQLQTSDKESVTEITYHINDSKIHCFIGTNKGIVHIWKFTVSKHIKKETDSRDSSHFLPYRVSMVDGNLLFGNLTNLEQSDWIQNGILKLNFDSVQIDDNLCEIMKVSDQSITSLSIFNINEKDICIGIGTSNGFLKLFKTEGDLIGCLSVSLPLPLKWDVYSSKFDFRALQIKKSLEALSSYGNKYKIVTQSDQLIDFQSKIFSLTQTVSLSKNEITNKKPADDGQLFSQAASQYFKLQSQEKKANVSLKKMDYDIQKRFNENYYEENARLRSLGIICTESKQNMMKMILNKKKEVFEKKVFKDYIESREKMNMEELDDMISKKRGIMMGKMGEQKLQIMNSKEKGNSESIVKELSDKFEQLEKDLDLERRMKIAGENKKIATRKTTIPILIDVGGFDIEDSAIQKNNSIIPNNRTKSQKSLIDWLQYKDLDLSQRKNLHHQTSLSNLNPSILQTFTTNPSTTISKNSKTQKSLFKKSMKELDIKLSNHKMQYNQLSKEQLRAVNIPSLPDEISLMERIEKLNIKVPPKSKSSSQNQIQQLLSQRVKAQIVIDDKALDPRQSSAITKITRNSTLCTAFPTERMSKNEKKRPVQSVLSFPLTARTSFTSDFKQIFSQEGNRRQQIYSNDGSEVYSVNVNLQYLPQTLLPSMFIKQGKFKDQIVRKQSHL